MVCAENTSTENVGEVQYSVFCAENPASAVMAQKQYSAPDRKKTGKMPRSAVSQNARRLFFSPNKRYCQ